MKKLLILIAAVSFSLASFAQNSTSGKRTEEDKKMKKEKKMDHDQLHYEMENGKIVEVEAGRSKPLTNDVTLEDGSVLMTDGTIKKENGMTKKLKDGECVYKDGKVDKNIKERMKEKKEEKKEMKKESSDMD